MDRKGGRDRMEVAWGDAGFADDTLVLGSEEEELEEATTIFREMARKAGLGLAVEKEETVRVGVGDGESAEAKYLGVWIPEVARDTAEKVARARKQMDWYAKAWKGKQVGGT